MRKGREHAPIDAKRKLLRPKSKSRYLLHFFQMYTLHTHGLHFLEHENMIIWLLHLRKIETIVPFVFHVTYFPHLFLMYTLHTRSALVGT